MNDKTVSMSREQIEDMLTKCSNVMEEQGARIAEIEADRDQWRKRYEKKIKFAIKNANEIERLEALNAELVDRLQSRADVCIARDAWTYEGDCACGSCKGDRALIARAKESG